MAQNNSKKQLGNDGETKVCIELNAKGYDIVEKNFHSRFGEIDIIAIKDGKLKLVEVKTSLKREMREFPIRPKQIVNIVKTFEYWQMLNPKLTFEELDIIGAVLLDKEIKWYRLSYL